MGRSSLGIGPLLLALPILAVGCTGELNPEEYLYDKIQVVARFLTDPVVQELIDTARGIAPLAIIAAGAGLFLFARRAFFRLHTAVLSGALIALILGIVGGIIGGIGAYASIYAVNNYHEKWIGPQGLVVTALGGALVGVIGMIAAILLVIVAYVLIGGLLSAATGSSVDIPIVDRWGLPTGMSLRFWEPGDVGGDDGGLGCGVALMPGFLVAPIVGGYAAVRLMAGDALDTSNASWTVALLCFILVGILGLLFGLRLGWVEGGSDFGGMVTGAFYGLLFAKLILDVLVLFYPTTLLRIVTYVFCISTFAWLGSRLAPK